MLLLINRPKKVMNVPKTLIAVLRKKKIYVIQVRTIYK